MFRVFRTHAEIDAYLARRLQDLPWRLMAVVVFGLGLLAVVAVTGKL